MIDQSKLRPMDTAPKDGTTIRIRFEHENFKYARDDDRAQWEGLHEARWIDHNNGGWTWHGIAGRATGWLPVEDDRREYLVMNLQGLARRMRSRVESMIRRDGSEDAAVTGRGVGIGYLLARDAARTMDKAATELEAATTILAKMAEALALAARYMTMKHAVPRIGSPEYYADGKAIRTALAEYEAWSGAKGENEGG